MSKLTTACQPSNPWLSQTARIERIGVETPGVATYDLVFIDDVLAANYRYRPGQFNMLYLPGVGEVAISISGNPADNTVIPHTIREAGNVTQTLAGLGEGSTIGVRGPFGSSWPMDECVGKDVILVAGGIGLAPLRPALYELLDDRDKFGELTLLYGARSPDGLLYPNEHDVWRDRGLKVDTTVDRSNDTWSGNVGVVPQLLDRMSLPRPTETVLLTCGPEVMMWYTIQAALRRGLPDTSFYVSLERNMNCAIGLCGHCQFGPEFLCKDGPVFRYDRVATYLRVDDL